MHDHIVAGYDGTHLASTAAGWAADEARRRGVAMTVATCYSADVITAEGISDRVLGIDETTTLRISAQTRLDDLTTHLRDTRPGVHVSGCVVHGRARRHLVELSRHADLLVIGSSGTGESPMYMLGSLANTLIRTAECPVVLVPGARTLPPRPRLVATIDASPDWPDVIDWASDEADIMGARLTIVHSWAYPYPNAMSEARDLTRVDAAIHLDQAVERAVARTGADVEGALLEGDQVSENVASTFAADLVVIGSPWRRTPRVVPSWTLIDTVVAHATCPLVAIRPREPAVP